MSVIPEQETLGTWALTDFRHYFGTDRFALRWHRSQSPLMSDLVAGMAAKWAASSKHLRAAHSPLCPSSIT
jgi:hypothetical protein